MFKCIVSTIIESESNYVDWLNVLLQVTKKLKIIHYYMFSCNIIIPAYVISYIHLISYEHFLYIFHFLRLNTIIFNITLYNNYSHCYTIMITSHVLHKFFLLEQSFLMKDNVISHIKWLFLKWFLFVPKVLFIFSTWKPSKQP